VLLTIRREHCREGSASAALAIHPSLSHEEISLCASRGKQSPLAALWEWLDAWGFNFVAVLDA
jgi:hypothetical protein